MDNNRKQRIKELKKSKVNTNEDQIKVIKQIRNEMENQGISFEYIVEDVSQHQDGRDSWKGYRIMYMKNGNPYCIQTHKHTNIHIVILESILEDLKNGRY